MFRLFLLIGFFLFCACARPVYLENPTGQTNAGAQEKSKCTTCVQMLWEQRPTETTFGSFIFSFVDSDTRASIVPPKADSIKVVLWMPSMGHGSSPVTVEKLSDGVFRASRVFFSMGGDWDVRFQLFTNGEKTDETTLSLIW
ncbi:MAG: FixH family protein [Bdellovibrionaceae bacterium]|nr:FixH family protein [Pseudobdellovibrionaceae bacterium]